jgi:hypothetical protein
MNKSDSIKNLAIALCKFQAEVNHPKNTSKNPQFNSSYAPLETVISTVKPILSKYGLSFIQSTSSEGENVIIETILIHESGEWLETNPLSLPAYQIKKGGGKEYNAQGAGSAITYGRRYSLSALLGISSEDDDDGNGVSSGDQQLSKPQNVASEKTLYLVNKLIKEVAQVMNITEAAAVGTLKQRMNSAKDINQYTQTEASKAIEILNKAKEVVA